MILLTVNLRSGRLGRILAAMRDSEEGAKSIGIPMRKYKLFIFSTSAFMAGIGGSLLSQSVGTFDPMTFLTFNSLLWFAVVVVAGLGSVYGALLGAFLFTMLGQFLGQSGLSILIIGLAALAMGRMPGGLVGLVSRWGSATWVPKGLEQAYVTRGDPEHVSPNGYRPSPLAQRILAERREAERARSASERKGAVR
jgi:ABC-type branched-subunit amino acid transport system permease subunit